MGKEKKAAKVHQPQPQTIVRGLDQVVSVLVEIVSSERVWVALQDGGDRKRFGKIQVQTFNRERKDPLVRGRSKKGKRGMGKLVLLREKATHLFESEHRLKPIERKKKRGVLKTRGTKALLTGKEKKEHATEVRRVLGGKCLVDQGWIVVLWGEGKEKNNRRRSRKKGEGKNNRTLLHQCPEKDVQEP